MMMSVHTNNAAVIKFSDLVATETNGYETSHATFENAVLNMEYERGYTFTGNALTQAYQLLDQSRIANGVQHIMVVMTDGQSNGGVPIRPVAEMIQAKGVKV